MLHNNKLCQEQQSCFANKYRNVQPCVNIRSEIEIKIHPYRSEIYGIHNITNASVNFLSPRTRIHFRPNRFEKVTDTLDFFLSNKSSEKCLGKRNVSGEKWNHSLFCLNLWALRRAQPKSAYLSTGFHRKINDFLCGAEVVTAVRQEWCAICSRSIPFVFLNFDFHVEGERDLSMVRQGWMIVKPEFRQKLEVFTTTREAFRSLFLLMYTIKKRNLN